MAFGGLFKKKKENKEEKKSNRYKELKVRKVIQETDDAVSLQFDVTASEMNYLSGQFLTLILTIDGKEVRRSYSLSSSPHVDDYLSVTIKRVEGGLVSNYIPDHISEGDTIKVMEPLGSFTVNFSENTQRHLVLFAGGSGITPMISLLKSTLTLEQDSRVSLIYCNRDKDSIIFEKEIENWVKEKGDRLNVYHVLESAPEDWNSYSGLIDSEIVADIFQSFDGSEEFRSYMLCGPQPMMKTVEEILESKGIPKDKVHKESFVQSTVEKESSKETESSGDSFKESTVIINYDGEKHEIKVDKNGFILETALDAGIDLPFSCQSGLCTACRCKKISGEVNMQEDEGLSASEKEEGYVLICVGHPGTEKIELEVG